MAKGDCILPATKRYRLSLGALFVLTLVSCKSAPAQPPEPVGPAAYTGRVMLYSSMQENQILAIKEGFEQKYPNVTMDYYFSGTAKVLTKIATENQSRRPKADVVWLGDPSEYVSLKSAGVLSPYISPQGIHINEDYLDPEHYFTGARLVNVGIAYNTELVSLQEAPKSWRELLDPRWQGKIIMTDPGSAGTIKYFVSALMADERYGDNYFISLRENGCALESGSAATHQQVASGNYPIGICLDYVTANLAQEGAPVAFIYPQQDLVSIYSPLGLVANCPNEQNGKLLYDFILSREGQEILVKNNLISIRNDIQQSDSVQKRTSRSILKTDLDWIANNSDEIMSRFDEIFQI